MFDWNILTVFSFYKVKSLLLLVKHFNSFYLLLFYKMNCISASTMTIDNNNNDTSLA